MSIRQSYFCTVRIFVICLCFFIHKSFAQYNDVYQLAYPQRFAKLDSIRTNEKDRTNTTEGRIKALEVFKEEAKRHNDKYAILASDLYYFIDLKDHQKFTEQEALNICNNIIAKSKELNFIHLEAYAYSVLGFFYVDNLHKHGLGLYYFLKSYELYKNIPANEFYRKSSALYNISIEFYRLGDYEKAIHFANEANQNPSVAYRKLLNYNLLGMAYLKSNKYDSALIAFDQAIPFAKEVNSHNEFLGWQGIINGNKAQVFEKQNNLTSAIYYFQLGIDTTYHYKIFDNTCGFIIGLSNIYLSQNKLNEVTHLLPLAKETIPYGSAKDKLNYYTLLKRYYQIAGNQSKAIMYSDSINIWKDTVNATLGKNLQVQAELSFETEKRQSIEKDFQKEINQQKTFRIITIVFFLLLMALGFLYYKRKKLNFELAKQKLKTEKQQHAQQLLLASQKLEEFANIITEKNKLIELLEINVDEGETNENIQKLKTNTILTDDQWYNFKILFEQVHKGYFDRMKEKIPGLTPAETRFLALAKLKLNNKEMAASLGITTHAVRTTWYRLRKKLNLPEEEGWDRLVDEI